MSRTTSAWIKPRIAGVLLASALALLPAPQTVACAFHTDLPEQTVGDWLVDGTEVVLSRPDPDNEFTFHVTKVIHTAGEAPEINLLVSSDLRRKLLNHPDDTVLLAHDGVSWLILAYVDTTFRPIITEILAKAPGWDGGYNAERPAIQHGAAPPEVRTQIAGALKRFVNARPEGAPLVARQFVTRQDWSQEPLLAQIMEEDWLTSAPDLLAVAIYVAQARGAGAVPVTKPGSDG